MKTTPLLTFALLFAAATACASPQSVSYTRDVRPILANNCFKCHGFDEEARQAGVRLDTAEGAAAEVKGHKIIVPGDPASGEFFARILAANPDDRMPPPDTGKVLAERDIATLKQWVAEGARYDQHWAFVKPERPALPALKDAQWPLNEIDYFILARLEQEGLTPSPPADKETLLRRVYLDLIGTPPTPEEVDAFVNDPSTVAYEKVVQRLLDSPHYGERWARPWLDMARYADTKGYEADRRRVIWQYRDWVIRALNADMPYDEFTTEQIAGDLLPNPTRDQLIATAFHRNTMTNDEGGTDNEEFRNAAIIDRVNTTAGVWLGLTMACAQCHTHKYDPITQTEFYRFYAYFNQTADNDEYPVETPVINTPSPEQEAALAALDQRMALVQRRMESMLPTLEAARAAWEQGVLNQKDASLVLGAWHSLGMFSAATFDEAFSTAFPPEQGAVDLAAAFNDGALQWVAHPEWQDGVVQTLLPADVGATYLYREISSPVAQPVTLSFGSNDSIKVWLNDTQILADHQGRGAAPDQNVINVELKEGVNTLLTKIANAGGGHAYYFNVSKTGHPAEIVAALKIEAGQRSPEQQQQLDAYYTSIAPELEPVRAEKVQVQAEKDALLAQIPTVPVLQDLPSDKQRETHRHIRGSFLNPGEVVTPAVPASLNALPEGAPGNRLGLARWLMDENNPLTARVMANRIWEQIFGIGIVETAEDFGTQGDLPTHPELLDWLATEFVRQHWSMKEMCRIMVSSATYRQSSGIRPEVKEKDPYNRLYAQGPRYRLSAESVRDQALAASGLLSDKMYGAPVMPAQPEGIWMVVYSDDSWQTSTGEDRYRRGVYTFWRRTSPYPSLVTFDAPSREVCTVRRTRTNTPLQAFVTLNDPVYVEAAQALARRTLQHGGAAFEERLAYAWRCALARAPKPEEVREMQRLCSAATEEYAKDTAAAEAMATNPLGPLPEGLNATETAAWTVLCNVILNLDETLTRI